MVGKVPTSLVEARSEEEALRFRIEAARVDRKIALAEKKHSAQMHITRTRHHAEISAVVDEMGKSHAKDVPAHLDRLSDLKSIHQRQLERMEERHKVRIGNLNGIRRMWTGAADGYYKRKRKK